MFFFPINPCGFSIRCVNGTTESCAKGTYSEAGQSSCTLCPLGKYCPAENGTSPIPCPLGTYSNETNSIVCIDCPAGFECSNTSKTPIICSGGTYSLSKSSQCIQCPDGKR